MTFAGLRKEDTRESVGIAIKGRQALHKTMRRLGAEALNDPDLVTLFSLAAHRPLIPLCDLSEAYEAERAAFPYSGSVLESDIVRAGLDPTQVQGLDRPARQRALGGKGTLNKWRFTRELDPCGLGVDKDATCLRPAEYTAGARPSYLHPLIPRIAIGWVYQPLVRQYVHLDVDFADACSTDGEFSETILPVARDAALGWNGDRKSGPASDELAELWDSAADEPGGPVEERVYWERKRLYLAIVPGRGQSNPKGCFWVESEDLFGQELIQQIGQTVDMDWPVESWGETDHHTGNEQKGVCLIRDIGPWNHDDRYDNVILTEHCAEGCAFLSGKQVLVLGSYDECSYEAFKEVKKYGDKTLIRLERGVDFTDTAVHHSNLATAIERNLSSAAAEHRLDRILAVKVRKLASHAPSFLPAGSEAN